MRPLLKRGFPPSLLLCRRRSYCFNQPSHDPRVISTIWKGREMHTLAVAPEVSNESTLAATKTRIDQAIDHVMDSLPKPDQLSSEQRRGMIARYTSVLEGNFIYWMTATYLSVQSEAARPILIDNLTEEVGDCHPEML